MEDVCGRTKNSEGGRGKGGAQRKILLSSNDRKQEKLQGTKREMEKIKQTKTMLSFPLELKLILVPHGTTLRDFFLCYLI